MQSLREIRESCEVYILYFLTPCTSIYVFQVAMQEVPASPAPRVEYHAIPAKPSSIQAQDRIAQLTTQLRRTRQEIEQNNARAAVLEKEITALQSPGELQGTFFLMSLFIVHEPNFSPDDQDEEEDSEQLMRASLELSEERKKREEVEQLLSDVLEECSNPRLVPGILDMIAMLKLRHALRVESSESL